MPRAYAEACARNSEPILAVLKTLYAGSKSVLEVGSGTGQHAVYFAKAMQHLIWHTSDQATYHDDIHSWLEEADLPNTRGPLLLDVSQEVWPDVDVDAVFSANTAHIMSWDEVGFFFRGVGALLQSTGQFVLYGPFNYGNQYTSDSNRQFDGWLKARDPDSGIRNFEDLDKLAVANGLHLYGDYEMPSNNRLLCWRKA